MGWAYAATKDNLPAAIAYEDEANVFTGTPQSLNSTSGEGIIFDGLTGADAPRVHLVNDTTGRTTGDGAFFGLSNATQFVILNFESSDIILSTGGNPRFRVNGATGNPRVEAGQVLEVGTNQVIGPRGAAVADVPAGGVGAAAGGWDTAANRDAAIASINALLARVRTHGLIAP